MTQYSIKQLSEDDWREYRSIRLSSLKDSPDAFGSTYDVEAAFVQEQWKSRLRISATMHDAVALMASCDDVSVGLLSAVMHAKSDTSASLYQMWVAPEFRGAGIGSALIKQVINWGVARGVTSLKLSVTTINTEAVSLYQSMGFKSFGSEEPLRAGSELRTQSMELALGVPNNPAMSR